MICVRRAFITALLLVVTAYASRPQDAASAQQTEEHCLLTAARAAIATNEEKKLNKNAERNLAEYNQIHNRSVEDLKAHFFQVVDGRVRPSTEFQNQLRSMGPDDYMLEGGAGLGGVAMTASVDGGFHSIAVNKQDFWAEINQVAHDSESLPEIDPTAVPWEAEKTDPINFTKSQEKDVGPFRLRYSSRWNHVYPESIYGIKVEGLRKLAEKLGIYEYPKTSFAMEPSGQRDAINSIKQLLTDLLKYFDKMKASGKFDYQAAYVEDFLAGTKQRFKLITDFFGAFYYSGTRAILIEQYYNHLSEGGKAFIYFKRGHVGDTVITHEYGEIPLWKYLELKYPSLIKVVLYPKTGEDAAQMIITKDPLIDHFLLSLEVDSKVKVTYEHGDTVGLDVPVVRYIEKSPP